MAEPFQHLFGESFGSKAEINSSVLKPRSPWEDESMKFYSISNKPKKPKLSNISDQLIQQIINAMDIQSSASTGVEKQKLISQKRSEPDCGDDEVLSHDQTCNTSEQTQGDEVE